MRPSILLNKALAQAGIASRRKSAELIAKAKVKVNNKLVTSQGVRVDPLKDIIEVSGKKVTPVVGGKYYFLLNKPIGYVTTTSDPQKRPTVMKLVPKIKGLFPVGRLDINTSGLLLITNDGDLAYRLMHPKFEVTKVYNAVIRNSRGHLSLNYHTDKFKKLEQGIYIDGKKTAPCKVKILKTAPGETLLQLEIHEGRKRQVRKMLKAMGHRVLELERVEYAGMKVAIKERAYRELKPSEIKKLYKIVGLTA